MTTLVFIEEGQKKAFASALEWPGWSRSARTTEQALENLADYAGRYAPAPAVAGIEFPAGAGDDFEVVEQVKGDGATDFGVPHIVAEWERRPLDAAEARRLSGLVAASWDVLEGIQAGAPAVLRKGPRGGGRDRDQIVDHVFRAEESYARKIGIREKVKDAELRELIAATLAEAEEGEVDPRRWPRRYAARRIAWHALDHGWEIEDKSE